MSQDRLSLADILSMYDESPEAEKETTVAAVGEEQSQFGSAETEAPSLNEDIGSSDFVDLNLPDFNEAKEIEEKESQMSQEAFVSDEPSESQEAFVSDEPSESQEAFVSDEPSALVEENLFSQLTESEEIGTDALTVNNAEFPEDESHSDLSGSHFDESEPYQEREVQVVLDVSSIDAGDLFAEPSDVVNESIETSPIQSEIIQEYRSETVMKPMTIESHHEMRLPNLQAAHEHAQVIVTPQGEYDISKEEGVQSLHQELKDVLSEVEQVFARVHKSWDANEQLVAARSNLEQAVKSANTSDIMRLGEQIAQLGDVVKSESPSRTDLGRLVMKIEVAKAVLSRYIDILWNI